MDWGHLSVWLIALAVLCWLIALFTGVRLWRARIEQARAMRERIALLGSSHTKAKDMLSDRRKFSRIDRIDQYLKRSSIAQHIDRQLVFAGKDTRLDMFLAFIAFLAILAGVGLILLTSSPILILFGVLVTLTLPFLYLRLAKRKRTMVFEQQLPNVLDFISRAMQAGHAFGIAMQMAASEAPQPIGAEFARAQSEMNYGIPVQKALSDLASRIDSTDLNFFAVAVSINREVGGDLAGLLSNLASLIRSRIEMRESLKAMTAEGRLSAKILVMLPFVIAAVLYVLQPEMISVLWKSELGQNLLAVAGCLMLLGIIWMNRIIKIRA